MPGERGRRASWASGASGEWAGGEELQSCHDVVVVSVPIATWRPLIW